MCITFKHFFEQKKEVKPHSATENAPCISHSITYL